MKRLIAATVSTVVIVAAGILTVGGAAWAASFPTKIAFAGETTASSTFGGQWEFSVRVISVTSTGTYNVSAADGSVDFLIEGIAGEYVRGAEIYPGGVAYFVQPANRPTLAPGEYSVTAVFTPASGSDFATSKTTSDAKLTITPLTVEATATLIDDPETVTVPTVRTSLAGSFVDVTGTPPNGDWTVTGVNSTGAQVFEVSAPQPTKGTDGDVGPLDIPITTELEPGESYTVTTVFTPVDYLLDGLEITDPVPSTFSTPKSTLTETLSMPLAVPVWAAILNGVLFIAIIVALVWLITLWSRKRRVARGDADLPVAGSVGE